MIDTLEPSPRREPTRQMFIVPNDPAGRAVIATLRAYLNRATYRLRVVGRGVRADRAREFRRTHRAWATRRPDYAWIPRRYATRLAVYIERKDGIGINWQQLRTLYPVR